MQHIHDKSLVIKAQWCDRSSTGQHIEPISNLKRDVLLRKIGNLFRSKCPTQVSAFVGTISINIRVAFKVSATRQFQDYPAVCRSLTYR